MLWLLIWGVYADILCTGLPAVEENSLLEV